ncbi:MAG: AAA family ATPase [Proteobacteria bacterium]|nr:AAA family ATPase [Pseudomonadota bacterium]
MKETNEKIPDPKEIEKEIGEFLNKKFGGTIKVIAPKLQPDKITPGKETKAEDKKKQINFDMKPEELVAYLDQYIVKQDKAKSVLATKICTHFNRIKYSERIGQDKFEAAGNIKSNILLVGPTGVGKTYMVKLIAKRIGVPFVKGDATKFSETGYVGGDVEDLVRDLVREADDDISLAQYGIIYIDEIDKIASSRNLIGADVSRTGVQRALLKPMEETDVEMKVPHDPVSMMQEMERYHKTGKREKRVVNTANILFIVSGAFNGLNEIIAKRTSDQTIGFGAKNDKYKNPSEILFQMTTEDLITFGFESEFVGRLPVRSIFEELNEDDLYEILKSPNNPLILGKKLDFASYGINIKFDNMALYHLAKFAFKENTGARGLVSAIEKALLPFECKLPSTDIKNFPVTEMVIKNSEDSLSDLLDESNRKKWDDMHLSIAEDEKHYIKKYIEANWKALSIKYKLTLSQCRIDHVASYYCKHVTNIGNAIDRVRDYYDDIKKIELSFFKKHDVNLILEEDAIDYVMALLINTPVSNEDIENRLTEDFSDGLKFIREKIGKNRFFLSKEALSDPDMFFTSLFQREFSQPETLNNKDLVEKIQ